MSFVGPGSGVLRYSRIAGMTAAAVMVAAGSLASLAGSPQATATVKPEQPPTQTLTVPPPAPEGGPVIMPPAPPGAAQVIILPPQQQSCNNIWCQ
jgi:hypothetical protein